MCVACGRSNSCREHDIVVALVYLFDMIRLNFMVRDVPPLACVFLPSEDGAAFETPS